jgi:hypothetical protein
VVVWADGRAGIPLTTDVFGATLPDRTEFPIATGPENQTTPDVHWPIVVWSEDGVIKGTNLDTGERFTVSTGPEDTLPAVSFTNVIWVSFGMDGYSLMIRDLATMADPVRLAHFDFAPAGRPAIDGGLVLWGDATDTSWKLHTIRVDGTDQRLIAESAGPGALLGGYDVDLDFIVFAADGDLKFYRHSIGQTRTIATHAMDPTTSVGFVFWSDTRLLPDNPNRVDIWGYDLNIHSRFAVYQDQGRNVLLNAGDFGYLAWMRGFDPPEINVHAAPIWDLVPTARRPDPTRTDPHWRYFGETGHFLAHGFRGFWERNGGLPVFGYPMTIELDERNPDLWEFRTVQYFERQRFEYHPEHRGTPYEIQLGRLGAHDAAHRGLLSTAPFQPLPADAARDANCTFFPQTRHRLCHGFRSYWRSHGLDFGDPGVSFRESVALFGYPISEEFIDPETGLVTQYFERARFEYHPDNPEPHRILLGRLGADLLYARGWFDQ